MLASLCSGSQQAAEHASQKASELKEGEGSKGQLGLSCVVE